MLKEEKKRTKLNAMKTVMRWSFLLCMFLKLIICVKILHYS